MIKSAPTTHLPKSSNKRTREDDSDEEDVPPAKEAKTIVNNTPNKTLLVQNLPSSVTQEQLQSSFANMAGLVDIRVVPGGRGLAFVEFENEVQSNAAIQQLNGTLLAGTSSILQLTFSN